MSEEGNHTARHELMLGPYASREAADRALRDTREIIDASPRVVRETREWVD
jgi:hypothetical protein